MMTLLEMAAKLASVAIETEIAGQMAVEQAAYIVEVNAKDLIGSDEGQWPALAESTLEDKARQGYGVPNPLLRTGGLRNSIERTVGHWRAWVGSNEDVAVWQELGTDKIPPRPFIRYAAMQAEDLIHALTVKAVGRAFSGHKASAGEELWRAAREAAKILHETANEFMGDRL